MKITCNKQELVEAVSNVQRAVSSKTTLAALEGILLRAEEGKLELCGYDLELGITTTIPASVEQEGSIILNAKLFGDIVRRVPSDTLTLSVDEKWITNIVSGVSSFHQKYRKTDILLVDDIQFIAGKDSTQEEFFHTFNTLYEANKQIVLTSDRPPKDIQTLEDRLRTRFEWGLIADIQPPDFETRIAIIKRKAELLNIDLPDDVAEYIATRLKTNIRQLEGAVKKMKAYYLLAGENPGLSTAQAAISDILNNDQPPPLTVEKIIEEVARTFGVSAADIRSAKRSANISNARQVAVYVVREITQLSMTNIGEEFGGRDHSTIVYAIQQVEKNMKKDSKVKAMVEDIIKNIRDR